jgi:hypothetical protein
MVGKKNWLPTFNPCPSKLVNLPGLVNIQTAIENVHRNRGFYPSKIVDFHDFP